MKAIYELLSYLKSLNVKLWADGDRLRYKAPRGALTNDLRDQLQENKTEILMFLRKTKDSAHSSPGPVRPVPREGDMPLSFGQQRIWFLCQLEKETGVYNESFAFRLTGQLDIAVLEQSLAEIIRRHEVLRTIFPVTDGSPIQVIASAQAASLSLADMTDSPENEHNTEMQQLLTKETQRPFDLERGPLLRITLIRLGMTKHLLLVTMHHIIFDAWSMGIFNWELSVLYKAFSSDQPSPLPDIPVQYADFAHWQRQWLQGDVLQTELNYWKQQLANAPPLLELPTDRPRPPVQTFQGCTERFQLSSDLTQRLEYLNQYQSGTTLFMTLSAAFAILLARYTGHDDIVIGSPIAGRNRIETEPLMGFFVNTLALRINLSGNPVFQDLLSRVREVTVGAYDHQDIPFERLVEALQPERNLSIMPLFQVMFVLQNAPAAVPELPGLTVTPAEVETGTAKFELTLSLTKTGQEMSGALEYNTDMFDAATIIRMAGHFQTLLEAIASDPDQRISDMPLLTETELHQMLVEWNDTKIDYPLDKCIHQLFEVQAEQTPDAIAVIFEDEKLTYSELNCRANQLAHHLQGLGVGPDVLVGICLERSLEMVVGLIGILKAGGAYVPLDPDYPAERLNYMINDSQIPMLLTQEKLVTDLTEQKIHTICLDTQWRLISKENRTNTTSEVKPDNLAYVIYTSGSTGKPKGTMNTHYGVCNHLLWLQDTLRLTESDRILQKTPFSFDVSVREFFWPVLTGACLVVAKPEGHKDSSYLVRLICEQNITSIEIVPSMLQVFLEEPNVRACCSLKRVICGGEALYIDLQERFFTRLPEHTELYNLCGATEAAIDSTFWKCDPGSQLKIVPIGRPIANTQTYILDSCLQPVPIGIPGELHIGGVGLARGYLNRQELTNEKFIPNPFSEEPESRLYKTGDIAHYLPDGNIEFLGRIDFQVKIRGFRIELGEIEAALSKHPAIGETVIADCEDIPGNKRLVAYFVPVQEDFPDISELRSFLRKKLPDYMIPSVFVKLNTIPLTPNGKINRRALPAPEVTRPELEQTYVAPRNPLEDVLADIWADVLGLEKVGVHDNFFELGGHSLQAIQLLSKMSTAVKHNFSVKNIFLYPTIASFADTIEKNRFITSDAVFV